jgi:hypothetical protein
MGSLLALLIGFLLMPSRTALVSSEALEKGTTGQPENGIGSILRRRRADTSSRPAPLSLDERVLGRRRLTSKFLNADRRC